MGDAGGRRISAELCRELLASVRAGRPTDGLAAAIEADRALLESLAVVPDDGTPYSRLRLHDEQDLEVMLATWAPGVRCAPHDHGGSGGCVTVLHGTFEERRFGWRGDDLVVDGTAERTPGGVMVFSSDVVHDMVAPDGGITLHAYSPAPASMRVFDVEQREVLELVGDFGAWVPDGDHPRRSFTDEAAADLARGEGRAASEGRPVIWVAHTIRYRGGSDAFAAAARTMVRELGAAHPDADVELAALDGKADWVAEMDRIAGEGRQIDQLHFIGHSGMYGPMFKSTDWPEQFSPHEWRSMSIPFGPGASAHFHACRTARWFAPFFARTFGVPTAGNHGYTTVSARKDRFAWAGRHPEARDPLYLVATPGKKSHGIVGSVRKYLGAPVEPMIVHEPADPDGTTSYDKVAELYDRAYVDIKVREPEWAWIERHAAQARAEVGGPLRVLEVGCGNGALLRELDDRGELASGVGLDDSIAMVERARARSEGRGRLRFDRIDGPVIDLPDDAVDVVLSFLSFRYLDWDPIMAEVRRVLAPGGRLWVVDMVAAPVKVRELPLLVRSSLAHLSMPKRHPQFAKDLDALTTHPDWLTMLRYNPIRAEHEYRWYLESRFPGHRLEVLNVTPTQRVVAFDSGPLDKGTTEPLSYP